MMTIDANELDVRKYFQYKLIKGIDERYAIARPVGDYEQFGTFTGRGIGHNSNTVSQLDTNLEPAG